MNQVVQGSVALSVAFMAIANRISTLLAFACALFSEAAPVIKVKVKAISVPYAHRLHFQC